MFNGYALKPEGPPFIFSSGDGKEEEEEEHRRADSSFLFAFFVSAFWVFVVVI